MAGSTSTPTRKPLGRRALRWALEAAIVIGVYLAISAYQERNLVDDTRAPRFTLRNLDGHQVRLEQLAGKRVLLHFWATWCGVCRREFGALNAIYSDLDDDEVLLSIVADSDDPAAVRRFVAEHDIRYPVLLATTGVLESYRVSAFPTSYYLDPQGKVVDSTVGMSTRWAMAARLGCAR